MNFRNKVNDVMVTLIMLLGCYDLYRAYPIYDIFSFVEMVAMGCVLMYWYYRLFGKSDVVMLLERMIDKANEDARSGKTDIETMHAISNASMNIHGRKVLVKANLINLKSNEVVIPSVIDKLIEGKDFPICTSVVYLYSGSERLRTEVNPPRVDRTPLIGFRSSKEVLTNTALNAIFTDLHIAREKAFDFKVQDAEKEIDLTYRINLYDDDSHLVKEWKETDEIFTSLDYSDLVKFFYNLEKDINHRWNDTDLGLEFMFVVI